MNDKKEKTCITCGRIITDKNNKTGLCPKCAKKANAGAAAVGLPVLGFAIKKW